MPTSPTNQPILPSLPSAPNSATQTPVEFDATANAWAASLGADTANKNALAAWENSTAQQVYQNALESAASATASAASADLAQDALDNAISATNYKGAWSSLTGALNIPASVSHSDGIWLLTTNLANVAASEPSETNADWLLVFRKATDLDVENGTQYANPDAKQLKDFVQRDWHELTTSKSYNESCFYRGKEYDINNPVDDVTIAPPTTAGRSYTEFDGVNDYIQIPAITLQAGDVVKLKFVAPTSKVGAYLFDSDLANSGSRAYCILDLDGRYYASYPPFYVDGIEVYNGSFYPTDGLIHSVEMPVTANGVLGTIGNRFSFDVPYKGRIYDLEVIRSGTRIHYFPLRVDAVDYLAGNLVKDEEFTYSGNWDISSTTVTIANAINFNNSGINTTVVQLSDRVATGTYRYIYDYNITSGSVRGISANTFAWDTLKSGAGRTDKIVVHDTLGTGEDGFITGTSSTTGTVKNFRVIKLNELSPSASFTSATGFALSGGVTITGGQAVFGSGVGAKAVRGSQSILAGKKVRVAGKFNGGTLGSFRVYSLKTVGSENVTSEISSSEGVFDQIYTLTSESLGVGIITENGWNGNVEYFSVTEVTDGTEVGSPLKSFEKHWKLKSGEQYLTKNAGVLRFGSSAVIDANNTLEIEPLANGSKGDYIKVTRTNSAEPTIKLSAADITAGRLIKFGVQTDTELTIDSDKAVILEHNGKDIEVKI